MPTKTDPRSTAIAYGVIRRKAPFPIYLVAVALLLMASQIMAGERYERPPGELEGSARVLFYLHGAIVEGRGSGVEHPSFGPYEYDEVADRFSAAGWVVISEVRPSGTRVQAYAEMVAGEIEELLASGIEPGRIAVMGHSKGGGIALRVASLLRRKDLRFVILAACFPGTSWKELNPEGSFLSVYDADDKIAGSCRDLGAPENQLVEVRLEEGQGHGLFFRARDSWVKPVLDWLR